MQYQVTIQDSEGTTCRIALSIPFVSAGTAPGNSQWRVLDQGMIKYQGGGCYSMKDVGLSPTSIGLMIGADGAALAYGVMIGSMFDSAGLVNSSGGGDLAQPWAVGMNPGAISWRLSTGDAPAATSKTASADDGNDNNAVASTDSSDGSDSDSADG